MSRIWRDALVIGTIDFGTTYSGYTISFKNDYDKETATARFIIQNWNNGNSTGCKTKTCVLVDPNGRFDSFGYQAQNKYVELVAEDEHKEWRLFQQFKMLLYQDKTTKRELQLTDTIPDTEGRPFSALKVFSCAIEYMKSQIINNINEKALGISEDEIYYVLTVPAIWSESAKAFMRQASIDAGIQDSHLCIGLEPECAALYILKSQLRDIDQTPETSGISKPGAGHMIVDLGGGTIDIAAHRIRDDCHFEEMISPCGGPWGSSVVNQEILNFFEQLFGEKVFNLFKEREMEDYLGFLDDIEHKKCSFVEDESKECKITIRIPCSLVTLHERNNSNVDFSTAFRSTNNQGAAEFTQGKLRINQSRFKQFFKPAVDGVIQSVTEALSEIRDKIDLISFVGGFSDCHLLKKRVRETFSEKRVVIPNEAVATVMRGAAIFDREQSMISKRVSRFTYGVDWNEDFDPKRHPEDKKESTDDGDVCKDIFKILVRKGDLIQYNSAAAEIEAYPKYKHQTEIEFPFYRSMELVEPKFVTDRGCERIGCMSVHMTEKQSTATGDRCIKLKVFFGDTELKAEATDEKGRSYIVKFDLFH